VCTAENRVGFVKAIGFVYVKDRWKFSIFVSYLFIRNSFLFFLCSNTI
jgi:hypothetical protein